MELPLLLGLVPLPIYQRRRDSTAIVEVTSRPAAVATTVRCRRPHRGARCVQGSGHASTGSSARNRSTSWEPIRLELQNLRAELAAALTVMGILDVLRVRVHGCVSGEISGPALGVLASCADRTGYPNATFTLAEPRLEFGGTVTAVTARQQQVTRMLDTLYFKMAEVTGREVDEIREDARRRRCLTTAQAVGYGLIQAQETTPRPGPASPG